MRVTVTGGAGFIGGHVAEALVRDRLEVQVVDDLSTGRRENVPAAADFAEVDLRDRAALGAALARFRPEVVCHQAAQTSVSASTRDPLADAEINVLGSLNLLTACVEHDVARVVFASTGGAIYGEVPEGRRAGVDAPLLPASPYGCSKLAVESYLRAFRVEHGLDYTILRCANVYGPRQDPLGEAGVIAIFARRLLAHEPVQVNARATRGDAGCVRDYVYVDDVVAANLTALRGELDARIANVCTGTGTATLELARRMKTLCGSRSEIVSAERRPGDLERAVLEPDPAQHAPATDLESGLRKTLDWFAR